MRSETKVFFKGLFAGLVVLGLLITSLSIINVPDVVISLPQIQGDQSASDLSVDTRQAELHLIRLDLNEYPHLSTELKDEIVAAIDSASGKYSLPPALLHAVFQIESEYQFNIDHPDVTITHKGKRVKTKARGLGGIMWVIWEDSLKTNRIAETSSDLYVPRKNVKASAYILRLIVNQELKKKNDDWIIRRVIARYYGEVSPSYENRLKTVTSNLWLKRIARELIEPQDSVKVKSLNTFPDNDLQQNAAAAAAASTIM